MTARTAHGSAARNGHVGMVIESLPADELPPATASAPVKAERDALGRFRPGNLISKKRRCRPNVRGVPGADLASPQFRTFANWGRRYGSARRAELAQLHGGKISEGVGSMIESAAMALAGSRFTAFVASQTGDTKLLAQSIAMATTARQHELAAWEIASREAAARPRAPYPWWGDDDDTEQAPDAATPVPDDLPEQDELDNYAEPVAALAGQLDGTTEDEA